MRKAIFTLAILIPSSILIGSAINSAVATLPTVVELIPAVSVSSEKCFEDMPCWDCTTMGNRICGLTVTENATELLESRTYNGTELPRTN